MADPNALVISEADVALAWNVRGDMTNAAFVAAVERVIGIPLPTRPNASARGVALLTQQHANGDAGALLWLGPRSWLFVAGRPAANGAFDATRTALNDAQGALFDVSSSYVGWTISGAATIRVLNRGCPLDLNPAVFRPGDCAQSVLGHVNALFYRPDEGNAFIVLVARSFAADVWEQLAGYAASDGYRLGPRAAFGLREAN
ncbi:MAG TPA: sarcosine oxidase subunit gamma family protein [Casimicrobiaceae bacterium]|nr:sarcosine oxidase subunit gamma family protein [Casimicrobiaceae bacterium]